MANRIRKENVLLTPGSLFGVCQGRDYNEDGFSTMTVIASTIEHIKKDDVVLVRKAVWIEKDDFKTYAVVVDENDVISFVNDEEKKSYFYVEPEIAEQTELS